jgi:hypothetical protein
LIGRGQETSFNRMRLKLFFTRLSLYFPRTVQHVHDTSRDEPFVICHEITRQTRTGAQCFSMRAYERRIRPSSWSRLTSTMYCREVMIQNGSRSSNSLHLNLCKLDRNNKPGHQNPHTGIAIVPRNRCQEITTFL